MPTPARRFWRRLGGPGAVRIVYVFIFVYALIIGGLMVGYSHVQKCLAGYADANAVSSQARTQAAADDRVLLQRVSNVDKSDRDRIFANQQALSKLVRSIVDSGTADRKALNDLVTTSTESLKVFDRNEQERTSIAQARAAIERTRSANPVPGPPSEQC